MGGIHILGVDKSGVQDIQVDKKLFSQHVGESLADLYDSAIEPANELANSSPQEALWNLQWFNVGLGIEGKVGIVGIATFSAKPRIRLYFKKNDQFVFDD